ncbi:ferritin-like domain-containing protein [Hymenobacter sp. M29]|uniref:Ferritin-like domain-containing protein n=1 Tax=Hymenobacter mellowenesis TaxID=3063995 RepID=A0ABT9AB90_9BACT|nr:ferritin-like domain-containing protein [Hymenobacter sp. M29]MDO7846261.1 ferritin-like domain-containing protein [Hymenobacter sp. M29]
MAQSVQIAEAEPSQSLHTPMQRRSFFKYAGATAGATALVLAGCSKDDSEPATAPVNVGSGDIGVLNYAYALEQLEAAFYAAVRGGSYYTSLAATSAERLALDDLYYHEVIHRDFLKAAITAAAAGSIIPALEVDFTTNAGYIDFTTRASVLNAARVFEDLGVAAYNGAAKYITDPKYLVLAGKIVSVEARHAALIRDFITEATFIGADVARINTTALEISREPAEIVSMVNNYLKDNSKLDVSGLK